MKKKAVFLILTLMLVLAAQALADGIVYTGTVSKTMTIRKSKSTSAGKAGSVEPGELMDVIEYGEKWTKVQKDGATGYVLSKNVVDLALADGYNDEAEAQYIGVAAKEITVRKKQNKAALRMQMLAEG